MNSGLGIKVGFIFHSGTWMGGRNYLRNLFAALRALPGNRIVPIIFTGDQNEDFSGDFPQIQVIRTSLLRRKSPAWFARKIVSRLTFDDMAFRSLLNRNGVAVLSHSGHLGGNLLDRGAPIRTIGWIPDFQHLHLPEFFSSAERMQRDREFHGLCANCDRVIVSSQCARVDLESFAPQFSAKAAVLQFVATPAHSSTAVALQELQQLYNFDSPYFFLPNQFWAHKNHRTVIRALQLLKQHGRPVTVLATGATNDYRNPEFFSSLVDYVRECDVLDVFRILGSVPFDHLVGLMRHSIALINPSQFEGWSTTVEESKSMGKQILLSDIAVHREQAPERGVYFPPDDPNALANAILDAQCNFDQQNDAAMQQCASTQFKARQIKFGETYSHIVTELL